MVEAEGNTVLKVDMLESWRIRRAWTADSWTDGILKKADDEASGFAKSVSGSSENAFWPCIKVAKSANEEKVYNIANKKQIK